jgi:hypothetical protein
VGGAEGRALPWGSEFHDLGQPDASPWVCTGRVQRSFQAESQPVSRGQQPPPYFPVCLLHDGWLLVLVLSSLHFVPLIILPIPVALPLSADSLSICNLARAAYSHQGKLCR